MELTIAHKQLLHEAVLAYLDERVALEKQGMTLAQEAANSETKSSAGDKYETGRAMAQLEKEKFAGQLQETLALRERLQRIDPTKPCGTVAPGAALLTSGGAFYCAIAADEIELEGEEFLTISLASPLGKALHGASAGESRSFRGREYTIEALL